MGPQARREYADDLRRRYARADRSERSKLLNEFTAVTGYHRKYAIALLGRPRKVTVAARNRPSRFDDEVIAVVLMIWRAAGFPWSRRLVAMLPLWLPWVQSSLDVSERCASIVASISARSIDRILRKHRLAIRRRVYGRTKPGTLLKHSIPTRTQRWDVREPGWCEVDTVAHCGESTEGQFACSVNLTDVASGWTETRAVLGKGQLFVIRSLDDIRLALPFVLRGIDSDSGAEFINNHCFDWCAQHNLEFTRSRPYRKNDNAHIEQKNWTHVRKVFGWKRIDSPDAIYAMNELYRNELRLWMNYFQPSVKLVEKQRLGSRVRRRYDTPKTPLDRLVELGTLDASVAAAMQRHRATLNPFALAQAIEVQIEQILRAPSGPIKSQRHGPRLATPLSTKEARAEERRASAPVRSRAVQ
jgi:hypothetical protein